MSEAHWNGEKCTAVVGTVVVGRAPQPTWWCAKLVGQRIKCVRVEYQGDVFYLNDDDGSGTHKVFGTKGGPFCAGHASIPVDDEATFQPGREPAVIFKKTCQKCRHETELHCCNLCGGPIVVSSDMEWQIWSFVTARWGDKTLPDIGLKLGEECGEVMGAIVKIDEQRATYADLAAEVGDALIVLSQIAFTLGTTIEELRRKRFEEIKARVQ